ncbi:MULTISPECIES: deoxynucleoside kinase [Eikenella]|uniref:Deoxyguanosine kinase n=1 Tax=Eikenella longinqua TaxID=1795827 RepID=A0A1A9RYI0_9NEIS|nr:MULTISPECIES: deoxynucleoside kinase [Eikenella]OAM28421.1 deoxyguanosine kinase [Eikenella longinqua]
MQTDYRYIVVEGPIGSGKSPLSRKLAEHFGCTLLSEQPEQNPFLEQFYLNAANHGLATELYFLLRRAEVPKLIAEADEIGNANHGMHRVVSDFLLEKDQIFVPTILREDEQALYWQLKQKVMPEIPVPDLVIYLQTSAGAAEQQLRQRGDNHINLFPPGYLQQIHDEYHRYFYLYDRAPLLIANTDELDFINNPEHFDLLLHAIANLRGSRHYLNLSER